MHNFLKTMNFLVAGTPLYIIFILLLLLFLFQVVLDWNFSLFFLELCSDLVRSFELVLSIKFYFSLLSEIMNLEIF